MGDKKLRAAMFCGTFSLAWTVPSMNIIGLVAFMLSWLAYLVPKRKHAIAAGVTYILAVIMSLVTIGILVWTGNSAFMIFAATVPEKAQEDGNLFSPLLTALIVLFVIGCLCYLAAAALSFLSGSRLPKGDNGQKSFFD